MDVIPSIDIRGGFCVRLYEGDYSQETVFSDDPVQNPNAVFFDTITYDEVLGENLKIMDAAAFAMCRDNSLHIIVFDFNEPDNLLRIVMGESIGTLVKGS